MIPNNFLRDGGYETLPRQIDQITRFFVQRWKEHPKLMQVRLPNLPFMVFGLAVLSVGVIWAKTRPTAEGLQWIDQTVKHLTIDEKIGQMLQIRVFGDYLTLMITHFVSRYIRSQNIILDQLT